MILPQAWRAYISDHRISRTGIIRDVEENLTEDEIVEGLEWDSEKNEMLRIKRFMRKNRRDQGGSSLIPTKTIKIVLAGNSLPSRLIIYKTIVYVVPFEQRVVSCRQCQRYGHLSKFCRGDVRCCRCGERGHEENQCVREKAYCANCKQEAPASHANCPEFTKNGYKTRSWPTKM